MRVNLVNLNITAFNKLCGGLIVKFLEIPHYAYLNRCASCCVVLKYVYTK